MKKIGLMAAFLLVACSVLFLSSMVVYADVEVGSLGKAFDSFTIGGEIDVFYRYTENPAFGGEENVYGYTPDTSYGEVLSRIKFTAMKKMEIGTLSAQMEPYYAETIGEDLYGIMVNNTNHLFEYVGYDKEANNVGLEQGWVKLGKMFSTPFDLTVGRQNIKLEKCFVIADGSGPETAYWLGARNSFPLAVRLDGDFGPLKSTLFWAQADKYFQGSLEEDVKVYGLNLHYDITEKAYIYGGVFQKDEPGFDKSSTAYSIDSMVFDEFENDTLTYDLGADVTIGGLQLESELAWQSGDVTDSDGNEYDRNSLAYWASVTYRFNVSMSPYVRAMYVSFSGDKDGITDGDIEDYDPMFGGFCDWNRWIIGEMVGEAQLLNTNKKNIVLEVGVSPVEPMTISLMYIKHKLAENDGSDDWADEINLIMDYFVGDNIYLHVGLGCATPGEAAKNVYGNDKTATFAQAQIGFSF